MRAGLLFRAGRADETLATAGRTHLSEHLALSASDLLSQRSNGFVTATTTGFSTYGTPDDVAAFMRRVCENLADLPGEPLDSEKRILLAEAASRSYDPVGNLLFWRFGLRGWGLVGVKELGLGNATIDALRQQATRMFTKENAVLWMTGQPPTGLSLPLPSGARRTLDQQHALPRSIPSWFVDDSNGGIAASMVVPRCSASTVFCGIANRGLQHWLRTEKAISYSPGVLYAPIDGKTAHLVLHADAQSEQRNSLTECFGEVLGGMRFVEEAEIEFVKHEIIDHLVGHTAPSAHEQLIHEVQRAANDAMLGVPFKSLSELADEVAAVTVHDVAALYSGGLETALFAVSSNAAAADWMGERAETCLADPVHGKEYRAKDAPARPQRLVLGTDGVSVCWPNGSHRTVRYTDLAGALSWADGAVCLIGIDGTEVMIEPTLWRHGAKVREEVAGHLALPSVIDRGERARESIPKPASLGHRLAATRPGGLGFALFGVGAMLFMVLLGIAGEITISQNNPAWFAILVVPVLLMAYGLQAETPLIGPALRKPTPLRNRTGSG